MATKFVQEQRVYSSTKGQQYVTMDSATTQQLLFVEKWDSADQDLGRMVPVLEAIAMKSD